MRTKARHALPFLGILLLLGACAGPSFGENGPGATRTTKAGDILVDDRGMTLYIYDKDVQGESRCTGVCAVAWPPAIADKGAKPQDGFTLVARSGDTQQWAWHGHPLYGYIGDSKPGDVSGDGEDGVWHVVRK